MIRVTGLHKVYGTRANAYEAIRGIDLTIAENESVAIIGKSGSGKSTLMHLMAGLDTPTSGEIFIGNTAMHQLSEKQLAQLRNAEFGFIFQQFFLLPHLTVFENILLPLVIQGKTRAEREKLASRSMEETGLTDKKNNRATDLSGGQKQRVAIARALVTRPPVIFADEPTGNLDSETSQEIMDLLFSLQRDHGMTLVIVTHDQDIAQQCMRTIVIQDGRIK